MKHPGQQVLPRRRRHRHGLRRSQPLRPRARLRCSARLTAFSRSSGLPAMRMRRAAPAVAAAGVLVAISSAAVVVAARRAP